MSARVAQIVLAASATPSGKPGKKHPTPLLLENSLLVLPLLVAISIAILLLSWIIPKLYRFISKRLFRRHYQPLETEDDDDVDEPEPVSPAFMPSSGFMSDFRAHIRSFRDAGTVLFALEIFRTLCLAALLGLSIWAAIQAEAPDEVSTEGVVEVWKKHKHKHKGDKKKHKHGHHHDSTVDQYSSLEWGEFGACSFYTYTLIFSLLLLTLRPATPLRRHIIAHLDTLLVLGWCLYAYRDFWPLITTYLAPVDIQNAITWSRLAILSVAAILVPLTRPRTYVPVDPLNPTPAELIHPEQTSPWLFYLFYEYMTPIIWKAWRTPALPYDDLHPLADYDRSEYLYHKYVNQLDPYRRAQHGLKHRHLLLMLGYIFRWEFAVTCLMALISGVSELAAPVAMQQILLYLQTNGKDATIQPFVWVALLFLGPLVGSVSIQYYIFVMTRCLVRTESILTQLLFDHSLRLRMKDALAEDDSLVKEVEPDGTKTPLIRIEPADDGHLGEASLEHGDTADTTSLNTGAQLGVSANGSSQTTEVGSPSSSKGKGQDGGSIKGDKKKGDDKPSAGQGLAGKINVLMAADVESVVEGRDLPLVFVYAPMQLILCIVFLYRILSWSAIVGMGVMVITLPIPGFLTKINATYQSKKMEATDARVDVITEAVGALRMLKMFAWEGRMKERIAAKRDIELNMIWKRRLVNLITGFSNNILPVLTMTATFALYTLVEKKELTAATVFSSITVFELMKGQLWMSFYLANGFVTAWVSVGRINDFLKTSEMIDEFTDSHHAQLQSRELLEAQEQGLIRIKDASFNWGSKDGTATPGFSLHIPDVTFVKGKINLITGPTGSGKSSVLKALVGELHFIPRQGAFFHLPREGGVSYAAQDSWCLSETIKDNILFGEPFEPERYHAVVRDCGLEPDLKLLDDGDETEIGEKGVTLSGGQKARVTLARAVYSKTAVVLLDDIFSALDTLTSRWIIDHLFKGDLMQGRTVLLVTHHVGLVAPMADFMLALNDDGTVRSAGPIDEGLEQDDELREQAKEDIKENKEAVPEDKPKPEEKSKSKLIQAEEKAEGRISRKAMLSFFNTFGGPVFWLIYFVLLFVSQALTAVETYWLGVWARAYDQASSPGQVSVAFYLGYYFLWVVLGLTTFGSASVLYFLGAIKASRDIHKRLVDHIFGAYTRFLDSTPVGRIVSRFTKDMKSVDGSFTETFAGVAEMTISMAIKFFVVVSLVPFFSLPAVFIGALGGILGELYIHGQLSVKREMSNAKSPLFSHFSAAVNGIVSIRAYGAQEKLRAEARRRADKYTRAATAFYNLNRWVTVRIDMLGGLFAASLAAFLVYGPRRDASTAGFALSQAISFSVMILWWVRMVNQMEVEGNSVERIEDYLVIDQEPAYLKSRQPPAAWPTSGKIVLDQLSAKYSVDGPTVLDRLDVTIQSGEKVGIVGRTGSGKSTLALAMLRMVPTTGSVIIDGVKTEKINLEALRSQVTIIPQDPILLSGSLRFNLDPFDDHDDAELNDALQSSGLGAVRHSASGTSTPLRLTLDSPIAAGGGNLSQGQRQLVALARALVRGSKVLILDEATASVDFETDSLIQRSIRSLPSNTTVLTVAHRLATVMDYDKILVLGAGKVLEFDSPEVLKHKPDSYFAKLVHAMEG